MKKKEVGIWIDHKQAVIASINAEGAKIKQIKSDMEKHVRFSGGAADVTEEDMRDRRFTNHLNQYYDAVIACIRDADSILIFGPGEAKGELDKRLESQHLDGHVASLETFDKMSNRQIMAKVRQHYSKK
jgi:hypothetical protein